MLMVSTSKNEKSNTPKLFLDLTTSKDNSVLIFNEATSLLETPSGGGFDTCTFIAGPSEAAILAFIESGEPCGSIALGDGGEPCGSIAFSGSGEPCGSIASSGGGSFSCGGGCNYSC